MMSSNGYYINRCPDKQAQRFEIKSILTQASMKTEFVQINRK
jgi:hypothetical protein